MDPLTFVTFKWRPAVDYRSRFEAEHVRTLRAMVARHYRADHRFVCVTDDAAGLDGVAGLEVMPLWKDHADLINPNGRHNPSCYRRLKVFSSEAAEWFGPRIVCLDLDTVIVGDILPLFDRPEDFVIWGESDFPRRQWYNGSLWMLRTGTRTQVWDRFDPKVSPSRAKAAGARGSDQGWISHCLGKGEATWGRDDGVYSFRKHILAGNGDLPPGARLISFHGHDDPWSYRALHYPWIREHYREVAA